MLTLLDSNTTCGITVE